MSIFDEHDNTNNADIDIQEALALFLDAEEIGVRQDPRFAETDIDVTQTPIVDDVDEFKEILWADWALRGLWEP